MAARTCATMPHHQHLASVDAAYRLRRRGIEALALAPRPARRSTPAIIPVVIHVLWHRPEENLSEQQLLSQIEVLNEDFRGRNADRASLPEAFRDEAGDALVEFALARRDPQGQACTGITRTQLRRADFPW